MIKLLDHEFEFCVASGALGFDGRGWWFEQPFRWLGLLRPQEFTIITKTLTLKPRVGNLRFYAPWRCVRPIQNGFVNHVGLTNPGLDWWLRRAYKTASSKGYKIVVSIAPENAEEARMMSTKIANQVDASCVKGIELNVSCPNVGHDDTIEHIVGLVENTVGLPVILKLSYGMPLWKICNVLDGKVAAFDLINSVPWKYVSRSESPLAKYGLVGGVSGPIIKLYAEDALRRVNGVKTPIISGGGIDSYEDILVRKKLGASGFSFGTIFLRSPWKASLIKEKYENS